MSNQQDGTYDVEAGRRSRRRRQAIAGTVGLAAILGGGAFFVTEAMTAEPTIAPGAAQGPTTPSTPSPSPSSSAAPSRSPAAEQTSRAPAAKASRTPSASARPKTPAEQVAAARKAAAKDGVSVQRPVPGAGTQAVAPGLEVKESGSLREDRGTLRVVSARGDLTGFRELGWVADKGRAVGAARCTQTFRFANNVRAAERPNLLICWQTTAAKSVYTVMVDLDGDPSEKDSVAALAKQWRRMD